MVVVYDDIAVQFLPGQIVSTPGTIAAFEVSGENMADYLERHLYGDWAELSEADAQANENDVKDELRILSACRLKDQTKTWIITEADRSVTTFLLSEEY